MNICWENATKQQLDLLQTRSMALDLRDGMSESEAVKKYSSSKGTVGRVRKEMDILLSMDPEFINKGAKRKRQVKNENLEINVTNFVNAAVCITV